MITKESVHRGQNKILSRSVPSNELDEYRQRNVRLNRVTFLWANKEHWSTAQRAKNAEQ